MKLGSSFGTIEEEENEKDGTVEKDEKDSSIEEEEKVQLEAPKSITGEGEKVE